MTQQDKEQLKLEIDHIFESGANEIRIFEMVVNFIDSRNGVNKNFVLADVSNNEALEFCDGVAFANYIEEKWKQYRTITNNEDAWCFKQWLVGK